MQFKNNIKSINADRPNLAFIVGPWSVLFKEVFATVLNELITVFASFLQSTDP